MLIIKVDNLPFQLPSNQIIYLEKEHNQFLNSCFSHTEEFKSLFSYHYSTLNNDVFYGQECDFIYIPQIIEDWNRSENVDNLKQSMIYNYPKLDISKVNINNSLIIDTSSYTKFFLKLFDDSITNQITNGLLLYTAFSNEFIYLPLTSTNFESLLQEIETGFKQLKVRYEGCFENFSLPIIPDRDNVPDDEKTDYDFTYRDRIVNEIRERIQLLRKSGHEEFLLKLISDEITNIHEGLRLKFVDKYKDYKVEELSSLVIDEKYRIILPQYNHLEIKMSPLPKALYLLFLRHPEGILFKHLSKYKLELHSIYCDISNRESLTRIEQSIIDICNPAENSINEKCSRIKEAFLSQFKNEIAQNYYITGNRGCPKYILLDRRKIRWDADFSHIDGFIIDDDLNYEDF